jgi:hypothetical protein
MISGEKVEGLRERDAADNLRQRSWISKLPPVLGPTVVPLKAPAIMIIILSVIMVWAAPGFFKVGNLRASDNDHHSVRHNGLGCAWLL